MNVQSAHSSSSLNLEKPMPIPPAALPQGQKRARPQPRRYVVHVPKDTVFRVPPPENARLLQDYTRRAKRRSGCSSCCLRACLYLSLAIILFLAVLCLTVVYLVIKPRQPTYTVVSLAVSGVGGNASAANATVRADNTANRKIGVRYDGAGSRVAVLYRGVSLAQGAWPASFYQAPGNVTVLVAKAKGAGRIRFPERVRRQMAAAERLGSVPFDVDVEVPVRLQLNGGVKTWAVPVTVSVRCAVAVDRLATDAKVLSRSCDVKVPSFLFWRI